jgi:DNA-directed RNA polymerase
LQKNKLRKTIQVQELKEKLDVKKTKQSIKPNTTHAMDAALVRETLGDLRQPIITIHDCYGTDIMRIDEVIYSINKNINRVEKTELKKDREHWFSIFIVL